MKRTEYKDDEFNIDLALDEIARQATSNGCDSMTAALSIAYIICLASGKKFQNGAYCPDPSDRYCRFYDLIDSAMSEAWDRFVAIGQDERLIEEIDRIQASVQTVAGYRRAFKKWAERIEEENHVGMTREPKAVRDIVLPLLEYKGGTPVYNPFAGVASYGEDLKIGNLYHAEEIHRETWGLGMMNLLMKGTPSENFSCRISRVSGAKQHDTLFENILCTTPFGLRIPDESGKKRPVEETMLGEIHNMLAPNGRMVMVVTASMLNRNGSAIEVRQDICEQGWLESVIVLPKGVFSPYTGIQTAILVIDRAKQDTNVKLIDATSCMANKKLDAQAVLSILDNVNYITEVSLENLQDNSFSWHFEKYEYLHEAPVEDGTRKMSLGEILCTTGTRSLPNNGCRHITGADLSSDPFNFIKDVSELRTLDVPDHMPSGVIEAQIEEINTQLNEISMQLEQSAKEKLVLDTELEKTKNTMAALSFSEKEIKALEDKTRYYEDMLAVTSEKLASAEKSYQKKKWDYEVADPGEAFEMKDELDIILNCELLPLRDKVKNIERNLGKIRLEYEKKLKDMDVYMTLRDENDELIRRRNEAVARENAIESKESELQARLAELKNHRPEIEGRKLIKLSRPSLIIGGTKPKAKFAFVHASLEEPVFLIPSNCFAFTFDEKVVSLEYLVYQISVTEFKDFGAVLPMFRLDDILNARIPVLNLEDQAEFMQQREYELFPYKKEIEDLKLANKKNEEAIMAALGSKQHDLGNLCPKITFMFADLYDIVDSMPEEVKEKADILRTIRIISEDIRDMNRMIAILSERSDFPAGSPVDLVKFFTRYVNTHPTKDYTMSFTKDDTVDAVGGKVIVNTAEIALSRVLMNIRENAEMHGFNPDKSGKSHILDIKLSVDYKVGVCHIDFHNNGIPMPSGMNDTVYATRGEYAGDTGHTGNGGWYIASMAKNYNGECHVNPAGTEETTIRITLPWINE